MASKVRSGFTLIEIVVTMGIVSVLLAVMLANYNDYNETQKAKQAALTLKNDMRFLQAKALSGEKPVDSTGAKTPDQFCPELIGYQITFTSSTYRYKAMCNPDQPNAPATTVTLAGGVSFSSYPTPFVFRVVSMGTSLTADTSIRIATEAHTYQLTVESSGNISDDGFQ